MRRSASAPAPRSMANGGRLPQIPAVKGNAQQFALQHDAGIVQHQIKRQRVPHAHMLGRDQHAAFGRVPDLALAQPGKDFQAPQASRAPNRRAIRTVALRGSASSGRKMIAMTAVSRQEPGHEQGRTDGGHALRHAGGDQAGQIFHIFAVQQVDGARMPPPAGKIDALLLHRIGQKCTSGMAAENSCSERGM